MIEFSGYIAKKWNISERIATLLCEHFEQADSSFFVIDYDPLISVELDIGTVREIYRDLKNIKALSVKKKRILTSLAKNVTITDAMERRITSCTTDEELEDIALQFRQNPRSKATVAVNKGLSKLADHILLQESESGSIEDIVTAYKTKNALSESTEEILALVKDLLVERFSVDDTVRSMVREIGQEDGFFEIILKNKKDKRFVAYRTKTIAVSELNSEEYLKLHAAEKEKAIRLKHGVQLFHVSELMRHHFITNPDSVAYDFLCEAIDECWNKILQPHVEEYVKSQLFAKAQQWAINQIDTEVLKQLSQQKLPGTLVFIGKYTEKSIVIVAVGTEGNLLGATEESLEDHAGKDSLSIRITRFFNRYKPAKLVIHDNQFTDSVKTLLEKNLKSLPPSMTVEKYDSLQDVDGLIQSEWMQQQGDFLTSDMKKVYALALLYSKPFFLIPQIGVHYFSIHPLQAWVSNERLVEQYFFRICDIQLHRGIPILDIVDSCLKHFEGVSVQVLQNIRKEHLKQPLTSKKALLAIEGVTEQVYKAIAGYLIFPQSDLLLDHTMVHPLHYELLQAISEDLTASIDTLISDPDMVKSYSGKDFAEKFFIDQRLPKQLAVGQLYPLSTKNLKQQKRLTFSELQEGAIIRGKVTNITKFGVFVDINAVCEGLIHISQLTDTFIETADQVVQPHDIVDVKILKIDKKKRRISLSLKKGGNKPKVRPSKGQLSHLAEYFKNR